MTDAPAKWGQAVSDASRMPRRSVTGVPGASAGVLATRSGAAGWLLFDSARIANTVAPNLTKPSSGIRCQMRSCGRQFLMTGHTDDLEFTWHLMTVIRWAREGLLQKVQRQAAWRSTFSDTAPEVVRYAGNRTRSRIATTCKTRGCTDGGACQPPWQSNSARPG